MADSRTEDQLKNPDFNYYLAFNITPSIKDSKTIVDLINKKKNDFTNGTPTQRELLPLLKEIIEIMGDAALCKNEFQAAKQFKLVYAQNAIAAVTRGKGLIYKSDFKKIADASGGWITEDELIKETAYLVNQGVKIIDDTAKTLDFLRYDRIEKLLKTIGKNDLYSLLEGTSKESSISELLSAKDDVYNKAAGKTDGKSTAINSISGEIKEVFKDLNTKKYYDIYLATKEIWSEFTLRRDNGLTTMELKEYLAYSEKAKIMLNTKDADYIEVLLAEGIKFFKIKLLGGDERGADLENCPKCGKIYDAGGNPKSCPHCHEPFEIVCWNCGGKAPNTEKKKICPACSAAKDHSARFDAIVIKIDNLLIQPNVSINNIQTELNNLKNILPDYNKVSSSKLAKKAAEYQEKIDKRVKEEEKKDAMSRAQKEFDTLKNKSPSEKADACLDIIKYNPDFSPALQFLKSTPPLAVDNITVEITPDNNAKTGFAISVKWTRSREKGVTFCLVRKIGKDIPKNIKDGDLLIDNNADISFLDDKITSGIYYSYAVFTKRMEIFSTPKGVSLPVNIDASNIYCNQKDHTILITWQLPGNSLGVTVSRIDKGKEQILIENAQSNYEDKNVEYGKTYIYSLKTNYHDMPASRGIRLDSITPSEKIDSFNIEVEPVKDNKYKIKWSIDQKNIELRILINKKVFPGYRSDTKECEIDLQKNDYFIIEVEALSGGKWLASQNSVEISTYSSCEIEKATTLVEESKNNIIYTKINIKMPDNLPQNAVEFLYCVRTKSASVKSLPYATAAEISKASDIRKIPVETCKKNKGFIYYNEIAKDEDAYYVTVFTVYDINGKKAISAPSNRQYFRELKVDVYWKVSKSVFGKYSINIEAEANYPFHEMPELIIFSNNRELLRIPKSNFKDQKKYSNTMEINLEKLAKDTPLTLKAEPVSNAVFAFRWGKGFSGKI